MLHKTAEIYVAAGRPVASPVGPLRRIERAAARVRNSRAKAIFDVAGAALILAVLSPVMALVAFVLIVESGGPVLFRQLRSGKQCRPFCIYKFRTMRGGSGTPFVQATATDPRVTTIGRFLRRTSLDELPQLFNVLRGEMSLVGPRPHPVELDRQMSRVVNLYWDRNLVKPGITGLAQISGFRGPTDAAAKSRRRVGLDRAYIRRWSLWLDLRLLVMTPFRLFGPNAV